MKIKHVILLLLVAVSAYAAGATVRAPVTLLPGSSIIVSCKST